jgi:hypothetical protein
MLVRQPYLAVAVDLQEAADMMHSDVTARLSNAVQDAHRDTGTYAYYIDHNGDGESGDVIYGSSGSRMRAPYEIQTQGNKTVANIDTANAEKVAMRVGYEPMADDDDNYASMVEAKLYTKGEAKPLCERFISKDERKKADDDSFAGKNKSFPILKAGDIMAAVRSIGRAGADNYDAGTLKRNIIRIAKAKGFESELPKAWRGDPAKTSESVAAAGGTLKLSESVAFSADMTLREAFTPTKQIKLISPGQGSSAFYPAEVLKRDGPRVFRAGTPMRIDHPTKAEESARPEGSVKDWGAVLAKDAYWLDSHKEGPGLYSEIKTFSDHAQTIDEKGEYAGVSIRANGNALMEGGKPVMRGGVPVLASFTSAEGVDMVTRAGAGGMFLSESARVAANSQEVDMTADEITKLVESSVKAAVAEVVSKQVTPLEARALRGDAMVEANRILAPLALHEAVKARVVESVTRDGVIPMKDGAIDSTKFAELVNSEAKREGAYVAAFTGRGRVIGMGTGAPVVSDPKLREAELQREKDAEADDLASLRSLGLTESAAKLAAKGRAA